MTFSKRITIKTNYVCKRGFDWKTLNFNPQFRPTTLWKIQGVLIIWILSRYSSWGFSKLTRFWFVPSECQWNPIHVNRKTGLHNHILRSLICNSCFPILPKLVIYIVKSWPSDCFFFATTRTKPSINFPIEHLQLLAQLWNKSLFLRWSKNENDWNCSKSRTFGLTSKFKLVLLHKIMFVFFK